MRNETVSLWNGKKGERICVTTAEAGCEYADGQLFTLMSATTIYKGRADCENCWKDAVCARTPGPGVKYFNGGVCKECWEKEMCRRRSAKLTTYPWPKQKERARIQLRLRHGVTVEEILENRSHVELLSKNLKTLTGRTLILRLHQQVSEVP